MAGISSSALDQVQLEQYLLKRKLDRPNFASVPAEQFYELTGLQKEGQFTPKPPPEGRQGDIPAYPAAFLF